MTHGRGRGRENKVCICAVALVIRHSSSCLALGLSLAPFKDVSKPFGVWTGVKAAPPDTVLEVFMQCVKAARTVGGLSRTCTVIALL